MKVSLLIIIVVLVAVLFVVGFVGYKDSIDASARTSELEERISVLESELNDKEFEIVSAEEDKDYFAKLKSNKETELGELQEVYNSLALDWQNCYAADLCLYYSEACVDWAENFGVYDVDAYDLHVFYSDACEASERDWDKYLEYFTGEISYE